MASTRAVAIPDRLRAIAERLKSAYGAERVILYGSYARGEATRDSDVDLLVVAPTDEPFLTRMATVRGVIRSLRRGMAIEPLVLTPAELASHRARHNGFVESILGEGVEL
ncbi:MAG: nucleotidyltransferase domain-containing protein [Candidatus Brocadiae bacterium]|nr:nucleotidyltransferase domain-containing protein [Candidatus Brocadiia bacterium]